MKLVVGLGNPGKEYENTRHNVGFIILDNYLKNDKWTKEKNYMITNKVISGEKVLFLKPLTYMNLSGHAVSEVANYYRILPQDILIIHDDLDLNSGQVRIKFDSSSGGHNGIKSIIEQLGTMKFARLKVGIGKSDNIDAKKYVLNKLSTEELDILKSNFYTDIIDSFLSVGIDKTMNVYNTKG